MQLGSGKRQPSQHCQQTHVTAADTTQAVRAFVSAHSNRVIRAQTCLAETGNPNQHGNRNALSRNGNATLVIRTPTIRKIQSRPLSRRCHQESVGAAAVPDGVPAGKLEPKTVTETGAAVLASWRHTQTVSSKHQTADAGRRGATQIFQRRYPGAVWFAATGERGGWPSRCSAAGIATEKCQNLELRLIFGSAKTVPENPKRGTSSSRTTSTS